MHLFCIPGLSLGSGLVVFATALSETYVEATADKRLQQEAAALAATVVSTTGTQQGAAAAIASSLSPFDYRYGWSFFAAVAAFIMAELAALFSISAYLRRFPTVEDMVREMVPGAERKLREHQRLSSEYLVRHSGPLPVPSKHCKHHYLHQAQGRRHGGVGEDSEARDVGPLLAGSTPPDICTTSEGAGISSVMMEQEFPMPQSFAGQTVPITIKRSRTGGYGYGTLPHKPTAGTATTATARGSTLQHPRSKKSVTIGTFQTLEHEFGRRASSAAYPGSAV